MTLLRDRDLAHAFDHASRTYDRLTGLNPGYRADLLRSARRLRLPGDGAGLHLLDLGCGTGASTRALLRAAPRARITAVDASAGMLRRALAKPWPDSVRFLHLSAEELTTAGERPALSAEELTTAGEGPSLSAEELTTAGERPALSAEELTTAGEGPALSAEELTTVGEGSFDAVFAAYLFRNVSDPDAVLATVRTLLRPGGRLAVHEYSLGGSPAHRALWTAVCQGVVIPAGTLTGDRALYRHLWHSVLDFDTAAAFTGRLTRAGFTGARALPLAGWQTGITHTFVATEGKAAR
ncbi:class I SAM-dependent methyltransferase [Streptomyces luteogriseus]|uniref:class I SAM-dependent methyltransferase n=2 Tax=Streptomyces luteogriseus TaxID=68233 RepID=UPI002E3172E5|nr:class I SAM-dependent methyltransferase [Streptomyces luteogriseus]WTJ28096.1 class I SAM-dependent methyltransferase [Streptomyces luteogriseus]